MDALRRRAWWILVAVSATLVMFGAGDIVIGPPFDPGITLGLTGLTHAQLQAESEAGYRVLDFYTRSGGVHLLVVGLALAAITLVPYRAGAAWAWRTMWLLPAWNAGVFAMSAWFGVAEGQSPPPPMLSAPFIGGLTVVALLLDAGRFRARKL